MSLACPFASAAANALRVGGLRVCAERLRQCVEREAADAAPRRASGEVRPSFMAGDLPAGESRLYVGLDGLFVPTVTDAEKRKRRRSHAARRAARTRRGLKNEPLPPRRPGTDQRFKEVKVGHVYDQSKQCRHAFATAGDADAAGDLLRTHAALLKFGEASETRSVTDAAAWILSQLRVKLPMLGGTTLDLPHLAGHVHDAADACLGEGSDEGRAWASARVADARARGPDALLAGIDSLGRSVSRSKPKREAVRAVRAYVANHRDMMDYPALIAAGWDVGSGPTDALCKALTTRLRGPGMKWDLEHAAGLMELKAMYASGQAAAYWAAAA